VVVTDAYTVISGESLTVSAPGILANDSDANGDALTAVVDTDVSHGSLTLNVDGSFNYTPEPGFRGTDSFAYHASDGQDDSNIVIVSITVKEQAGCTLFLPVLWK
jgi:large repetitive protein